VGRIVDDEGLWVDALEQVRRGDVGHIEGRVLAQEDDILGRQVDGARIFKGVVVADAIEDVEGGAAGHEAVAVQGEVLRRIVEDCVAAAAGLQQDGERGIPTDVDPVNRIHLTCDLQRLAHVSPTGRPISLAQA